MCIFMVTSCLHHAQHHSWRTTPCRRSATAYSMHSQPPSISGGSSFHPRNEDASCRGNRNPNVNNRAVNKAHPRPDTFSPQFNKPYLQPYSKSHSKKETVKLLNHHPVRVSDYPLFQNLTTDQIFTKRNFV